MRCSVAIRVVGVHERAFAHVAQPGDAVERRANLGFRDLRFRERDLRAPHVHFVQRLVVIVGNHEPLARAVPRCAARGARRAPPRMPPRARRACKSASLSFTSRSPLRTRAPSTKLMAVILPFTSACSSTLSAASSVPVDVTVSASGLGSDGFGRHADAASRAVGAAGVGVAIAAPDAELESRSIASGQIFGAASRHEDRGDRTVRERGASWFTTRRRPPTTLRLARQRAETPAADFCAAWPLRRRTQSRTASARRTAGRRCPCRPATQRASGPTTCVPSSVTGAFSAPPPSALESARLDRARGRRPRW